MRPIPLPNDILRQPQEPIRIIGQVIASVQYRDEPTEIWTVLVLFQEPPYFGLAHYFLEDTGVEGDTDARVEGDVRWLGYHENIVPAIRAYEQAGGDY